MKSSLRIALLLGVVVASASAQTANFDDRVGTRNERSADRLLREYDFNHDGRLTRDEMNRTIGWRFAVATRHAPGMTYEQFMAARADQFRQHNVETFRSLDWNGDGKLTLAEYVAAQRVRFSGLDKDATGNVSCAAGAGNARGTLSAFCTDYDTNLDGHVSRAELDDAIAKRFSQVAGRTGSMDVAQFQISEQQRFAIANARAFRRLDTDGDGQLSVQEFAGSELKAFARLDKNNNGVLEPNELHPRTIARSDRSPRRRYD
jgi:Ca2+-binding EF-hand superfamily protein